jgi:hypothetical protein
LVFRVKQERYIQQESREYIHLSELGLLPELGFLSQMLKSRNNKVLAILMSLVIGAVNIGVRLKMRVGIC